MVRHARKLGILTIKLQGQGNKGMPDRLFLCPNGRILFIEFKKPGQKPTPLQEIQHDLLRRYGFTVRVCDNAAAALGAIQETLDPA